MIDQSLTPFALAFIVVATVAAVIATVVIVDAVLGFFAQARRGTQPVASLAHLEPAAPAPTRSAA